MRRPPRGFAGHKRNRVELLNPPIVMDSRFAIEHLSARSKSFSDAAKANPDSPHALTWCSFATLLSGEARTLAAAMAGVFDAMDDAGMRIFGSGGPDA